jgi:hypothetical protein
MRILRKLRSETSTHFRKGKREYMNEKKLKGLQQIVRKIILYIYIEEYMNIRRVTKLELMW